MTRRFTAILGGALRDRLIPVYYIFIVSDGNASPDVSGLSNVRPVVTTAVAVAVDLSFSPIAKLPFSQKQNNARPWTLSHDLHAQPSPKYYEDVGLHACQK